MPDSAYERDILEWTNRQASLLRRLARGEHVSEVIDWAHVIEEVQAVGQSELRRCERLLRQALFRLLKLFLEPGAPAAPTWRGEIVGLLGDAAAQTTPSMRQRIDIAGLWHLALRQVAAERGVAPPDHADSCPFTVDELLAKDADAGHLAAKLG